MENQNVESLEMHNNDNQDSPVYQAPEVFFIGKAFDLVQGYNFGKNNDGYTGQYYEGR